MKPADRFTFGESLAYLTMGIADTCNSLKNYMLDHDYNPEQQFRITKDQGNRIRVLALPIGQPAQGPDVYPITELLIDAAPHFFPNHKAIEWVVSEQLNRG